MATFRSLGVSDAFIKALDEHHISQPTEIQHKAIPFLMQDGGDFIGQAQTGTGKTAAYGLPILHKVSAGNPNIQALILVPTRELAQQIAKQLFRFTKYSDKIFTEAVYGGEKIERQISALARPTQILVATPGRLIDLLERKAIDLSHIHTLVLDEADEMLSMGFKRELDAILSHTAGSRNTWLFSATMPSEIKQIIATYMAEDAKSITVNKHSVVSAAIEHRFVVCELNQKVSLLTNFLKSKGSDRGIVFCRTKAATQNLVRELQGRGFSADALHGDLQQKEREKVMRGFKNQKIQILVATDISARGIDVQNLAYVVHFQLPDQMDYYTHRSGRTGRAGKKGLSLSLILPQEIKRIKEIEQTLKISFQEMAG